MYHQVKPSCNHYHGKMSSSFLLIKMVDPVFHLQLYPLFTLYLSKMENYQRLKLTCFGFNFIVKHFKNATLYLTFDEFNLFSRYSKAKQVLIQELTNVFSYLSITWYEMVIREDYCKMQEHSHSLNCYWEKNVFLKHPERRAKRTQGSFRGLLRAFYPGDG